ncbi:MAG: tetratricopeptide repeat protein [Bernardetiaceae bacterium]|nr:tetratricopeptide repeat protein [Bernardetiaceae bacterium]
MRHRIASPKAFLNYDRTVVVILVTLCIAIYHKVGTLEYVFDDKPAIVNNKFVQKGIEGIPDLLTTTLWRGDESRGTAIKAYRPLTMITFAIDYELFGLNPGPFHWVQLFIYISLCIFSYATLRTLLSEDKKSIALLSSIIFAIHPVHTEVVCNLKSRDELLSLFFSIIALYNTALHIKTASAKHKYLSAFFLTLGLFSKETAVVFLGIIPLTYYFFSQARFIEIGKNLIPLFIGFTIFMGARQWVLSNEKLPWVAITVFQNPLFLAETWSKKWGTISYINGKYLQLMIFPYQLTFSYFYDDIPIIEIFHWKSILSVLAYALMIFYVIKNFKSKDLTVYGLLCYFAGLSIFSHVIIPFVNAMGERLAFTMSWGWCLFLGAFFFKIISSKFIKPNYKFGTMILMIILLIFFANKSYSRVPVWKSNLILAKTDEAVSPKSFFINRILGNHYCYHSIHLRNQATLSNAEKYIDYLIQIDPWRPSYLITKGWLLLIKGEESKADTCCFDKALYSAFNFFDKRNVSEDLSYNEENWEFVIRRDIHFDHPSIGYVYKHIGEAFFDVRKFHRAIACFEAAIPYMNSEIGTFYIYRDLGASYLMVRNYEKSIDYFSKAELLKGGDYYIYNGLGNAYYHLKDYQKANMYFEKAYQLAPNVEVVNNLIAVNKVLGDSAKVDFYRRLLKKR